MQIHVVQSGQTLSGIAEAYGTTAEEIVRANKLPNPDKLVVGQALVIPIVGRFYWVQRGDTLWSIARRFSIPMQRLAEVNRLSLNAPLKVGQRLYIPPGVKRRAEFNAYIEPRGATVSPALEASAREAAPYLTYLSPFILRSDATRHCKSRRLTTFRILPAPTASRSLWLSPTLKTGSSATSSARLC